MKHKHYNVIKAWAEGYIIQDSVDNGTTWNNILGVPAWNPNIAYRVKPAIKTYWQVTAAGDMYQVGENHSWDLYIFVGGTSGKLLSVYTEADDREIV